MAQREIRKILVANRGEIAVRVFRTARAMGIATVAVYVPEEKNALYVRSADEAFELPGGFLDGPAIIDIARRCGAGAIHPGYGFLSEKADFARACEQAGIIFIGPPAEAIARMGDKSQSRDVASHARVPMLKGHTLPGDQIFSENELLSIAEETGYPVMLKSSAGGGGKGMSAVWEPERLYSEYLRIRDEAMRLFRNSDIVLERYLPKARHIEVQILGNCAGKNFAIGDRDCSLQRYNQKVIEEAPAPGLDDLTRARLHSSAVALADLIGYRNAGTMEFLYDAEAKEFYFLEMNTRLQVEHPVTEMTSGLDLVAEQIRIASGMLTSYENVTCTGHAIEARICAELPDGSYKPATGEILIYHEPREARCDSGIEKGSQVLAKFDNMVAKCIVHGSDRDEAIRLLRQALSRYRIGGVQMNIPLLLQIASDAVFHDGKMYTRYLGEAFAYQPLPAPDARIAAALLFHREQRQNWERYRENAGFNILGRVS